MNEILKKIDLIENAVVKFGRIITHTQLKQLLSGYKNTNEKIYKLIKEGWLVKLKRELYYISKIGSFGLTSISNYKIANLIGKESFVSFEGALRFYGLFDQSIRNYRSISKKQYLAKEIEGVKYNYIKVKDRNYFGFDEKNIGNTTAKIAKKERAILDLLEYQRTINSISLVLEVLQNNYIDFDKSWFLKNIKFYSKITLGSFGLLLDLIKKDSSDIYSVNTHKNSVFVMSLNAKKFNKKWRIYYNPILEEQVK
ncbi:MAG TPA: hypothetical protein DCP02_06870 [Actinobacteria bacterium]|nr:hypothetical protein [Actinomycetota bacterium]